MPLLHRAASTSVRAQWIACTSLPHPVLFPLQGNQKLNRHSHHRHLTSTAAPTHSASTTNTSSTTTSNKPPQSPFAAASSPSLNPTQPTSSTSQQPHPTQTPPPPRPSPEQIRTALQYCIEQVQRTDPTGYLTTLFAPATLRPALFTLRALWIELSRIRQTTSDARIAGMKLSWWNTTIKQLLTQPHTPPPSQPVVVMLHFLAQQHSLTPRLFSRLVQAKLTDVDYTPPATITELDAYNESTYSSLLYLALQCVPPPPTPAQTQQQASSSVQADHVASHVGKAIGLTRLLQSLPAQARNQRCYIPAAIMQQCSVDESAVYRGEGGEGLREAVYELASNAKAHIAHARSHLAGLSVEQVSVLLDVVAVDRWLDRLEAVQFDVFDPRLIDVDKHGWEPLKLRWALWNHARKGTF